MNWAHQVTHVIRKDLRQLGAFVAAYVAFILIALGYVLSNTPIVIWNLVWLLLASMLVGLLVQSDSPYRSDAFWRTRPFDSSAIWFSKIAFLVLLIIGLPLLAEFASMRSHQVPAGEIASMLPALAYVAFSILLFVLLLGAITPNIATFLLVLFGTVIGQNVLVPMMLMAIGRSPESIRPAAVWWPFVALAIWLFVSWLQYRTRRRHIRVLVGVYALGWVVTMLAPGWPGVRPDDAEVPAELRAPVESWRSFSDGSRDKDGVTLTVRLSGGSEAHVYVLEAQPEIRSYFGSRSIIPGMSSAANLSTPRPPKLDSTTWVPVRIQRSGMSYQLKPSNRQLKLLTQGTPLRVRGFVEVFEPYIAGRVTLQEGAVLATPGEKLRIAAIEPDQENFATIRYSRFNRAYDFRDNSFASPPMFALRNLSTKEAFPFYNGMGSSAPGSILPSPYASVGTISLAFRPIFFDTVPRWRVDPPSNFELIRIGWRSVGTYPVNLDVATSHPPGQQ